MHIGSLSIRSFIDLFIHSYFLSIFQYHAHIKKKKERERGGSDLLNWRFERWEIEEWERGGKK